MRVKSLQNKLREVEEDDKLKIILSNNQTHNVRVKTKRLLDKDGLEIKDFDLVDENIGKIILSIERVPTPFKYVDELPNIHFGEINPAIVSDEENSDIIFQFSDTKFDIKNINFNQM